jgi:hypothetical protein
MKTNFDFSNTDVTVTLKGAQWFALMARLANKPLSEEGEAILKRAKTMLATQLQQAALQS